MEKKKILIAGTESSFILDAVDALIGDYELFAAYSKREILYKVHKEYPDLIIIGYLEPKGNSFSAHRMLREDVTTKHIPILVIDAKINKQSRIGWSRYEGEQMDAEGYMCRPVDPAKLRTEVKRIIFITSQKNNEFLEAFKLTELILLNQVENWKKKMIQMIGVNRIRNS